MSIQALALLLLIGRAISITFIVLVIIKQWRLMRLPIDKEVVIFRRVFFVLSLIILAGNIIPIIIDVLTLFIETGRPANLRPISVSYALSNSFTAAVSAALIWSLYRLAEGNPPPVPGRRKKQ